jgi:SAM-dependent methyltransferase
MISTARRVRLWWCALWLCMAGAAHAADYQPEISQPGKDVVWVPTPPALVERMLDLAKVVADDTVIDLGSGDGRLVITAAKRGAKALGIEYDAKLVAYAEAAALKAGVAERAQFIQADLFATDISRATVVTLFLGADLNRRLLPTLLGLKPGTRIVSNTHAVGDWPPDATATSSDDDRTVFYRTALLWIVPAKLAGVWRFADGSVTFTQRYQKVSGSVTRQGKFAPITGAVIQGNEFRFSAGGAQFAGKVNGEVIDGTMTLDGTAHLWRAVRAQ